MTEKQHDIAFLHTGEVHVASFAALMDELAPELSVRHEVAEALLSRVQKNGLNDELLQDIEPAMSAGIPGEVRAMRIDRAMAEHDVVVLAQASMAAAAHRCPDVSVEILSSPCLGVLSAIDALKNSGIHSHTVCTAPDSVQA